MRESMGGDFFQGEGRGLTLILSLCEGGLKLFLLKGGFYLKLTRKSVFLFSS